MFIFLCVCLCFYTYGNYMLFGKNLMRPSVIIGTVFILSSVVAISNMEVFGEDIQFITVATVLILLSAFSMGDLFVDKCIFAIKYKPEIKKHYSISIIFMLLYFFVSIVAVYLFYQEVLNNAYLINPNNSDSNLMLMYAREANLTGEAVYSKPLVLYLSISRAFSYVTLYCFLYNVVMYKFRKEDITLLFPLVIFMLTALLGGGRTQFIEIACFFITITAFLWMIKYDRAIANGRIFKTGIIVFSIYMLIFFSVRSVRGGEFDVLQVATVYISSSIPALDLFLTGNVDLDRMPEWFGSNSLFGIYEILKAVGFEVPQLYQPANFVFFSSGIPTNIYTALMRYLVDFGYLGAFIIMLILGLVYGGVATYILKKKRIGIPLLVYAFFVYPIFEISIEERVFMQVISVSGIGRLVMILGIFYVMKKLMKDNGYDKGDQL